MPALSPTMSTGNIARWHVKVGEEVRPGSLLADIETDKATLAFENQDDGFVAALLVPEGARDLPLGTPVALLVENEADIAAFKDYKGSGGVSGGGEVKASGDGGAVKTTVKTEGSEKVTANHKLGPAARMLMHEHGLSLSDITPTGPNNIITKGDVLAAIASGIKPSSTSTTSTSAPSTSTTSSTSASSSSHPSTPATKPSLASSVAPATRSPPPSSATPASSTSTTGSYTDTPNSQIRKIIAQRLLASKLTMPAMYLSVDAELDAANALRAQLAAGGVKVSINDLVIKAVAMALRAVPQANVFWDDKAQDISSFSSIDVSVAVATPRGLITPIVRAADTKSITKISKEVKELAAKARDNKLKPEEFTGGSFTISNLGMFGMSQFSAIINPPQAAIMAVGGSQQNVFLKDGKPTAKNVMTVTLSADNRVYDGELAHAFLSAFQDNLANPLKMMF